MNMKLSNRHSKTIIMVVAALLLVSFSSAAMAADEYGMSIGKKLFRGLVNSATGWLEFPKQIYMVSRDDKVFTGFTYGAAKGVAYTAARSAAGVYETGTFFVPLPTDYGQVMNPEYVWEDVE